ncbi:MAG: hypothetical protein KDD82_16500 [Planctomycetes bacterium]|nr:hypothetical protein [Planctomycetota bacterium]
MSDAEQRARERGSLVGDLEAGAGVLAAKLRSGEVLRERLELAARLGHPEARAVLGLPEFDASQCDLHAFPPGARVRVLIGAARQAIGASREAAWRDKREQALVVLEAWVLDPDPSRRPLVRDAVQRTRWETEGVDAVTPVLVAASEVVQGIVGAAPLGLTQDAFEAAIREVCAWVLGLGDPLEARAEARRVRARRAWDARELERCGRLLYEPLRPAQRVRWAVSILARCVEQAPEVSAVRHLLALAASPEAWGRAHTAFYSLRELTIQALANGGDPAYRALLELAETTAKVVYNASDEPAPFHYHRGWRIPLRAWAFAQQRDAAFRAGLEPLVLEP